MQQVKKMSYRQRIYKLPDGSIQLVFGSDPVAATDWVLLADHDVNEVIEVTDHVQP